jgi:hypothetical protein
MPREVVLIRDDVYRTRSYVPIPCSFWASGNEKIVGSGALLVSDSTAMTLWEEINRDGAKGMVVAAYFWYHGKKYKSFLIPPEFIIDNPQIIDFIEGYAQLHHPEIIKLKKTHQINRLRIA